MIDLLEYSASLQVIITNFLTYCYEQSYYIIILPPVIYPRWTVCVQSSKLEICMLLRDSYTYVIIMHEFNMAKLDALLKVQILVYNFFLKPDYCTCEGNFKLSNKPLIKGGKNKNNKHYTMSTLKHSNCLIGIKALLLILLETRFQKK